MNLPQLAPPPAQQLAIQPRRQSDVLDQADTSLYASMSRVEVQAAWQCHARLTGMLPRAECEPSPEQLGALRAKLITGDPPAVDFAIWGPHDRRHQRDRRTMAMVWIDGALQPRPLAGPSSFEQWDLAW